MESMLLRCPAEIRELIYQFALEDCSIHVYDSRLKRSRGGPNRPAHRRLPGLVHVSKQIHNQVWPTLARQCTLAFDDYLNFAQVASVVPPKFAGRVRHISLRGDVVPGQSLNLFPMLERVDYQQLGNCFYVSASEKEVPWWVRPVSTSVEAEMIEAVLGRSASLILIQQALAQRSSKISLTVTASVLNLHAQTVSRLSNIPSPFEAAGTCH
jgi:hypothetical protein